MKALAVLPFMLGILVTPAVAQNAQPQKPVTFNGMVFDAPPQGGWYGQGAYQQPAYPPAGYRQRAYAPGYPQTAYAPGYPQMGYGPRGYPPQTAYAPGYGQQGYAQPGSYRHTPAKVKTYRHAKRHTRYKSSAS
jgi:hypothetical protein